MKIWIFSASLSLLVCILSPVQLSARAQTSSDQLPPGNRIELPRDIKWTSGLNQQQPMNPNLPAANRIVLPPDIKWTSGLVLPGSGGAIVGGDSTNNAAPTQPNFSMPGGFGQNSNAAMQGGFGQGSNAGIQGGFGQTSNAGFQGGFGQGSASGTRGGFGQSNTGAQGGFGRASNVGAQGTSSQGPFGRSNIGQGGFKPKLTDPEVQQGVPQVSPVTPVPRITPGAIPEAPPEVLPENPPQTLQSQGEGLAP